MTTISGLKGMILEEVVLKLLKASGFRAIESASIDDKTLDGSLSSGLKVLGRGGKHQIDAIADSVLFLPFSNPQRLLIEAKCYANRYPVQINTVRNAVGVIKDVGEYWETRGTIPAKMRYHYLYALFSASGYTKDAERYAYAHDIYLFPIAQSPFIQPIVRAVQNINASLFSVPNNSTDLSISLSTLRKSIRRKMQSQGSHNLGEALGQYQAAFHIIEDICAMCHRMDGALIAMIGNRLPIFLVPSPDVRIGELGDEYRVSVHWQPERENVGWILRSTDPMNRRDLFSFDLPPTIFNYYADQGFLNPRRAVDLKEEMLSEMYAFASINQRVKMIRFQLDRNWLQMVREGVK